MSLATPDRVDPRVRRTRGLLHDALRSLAAERPLDQVSVADITDRATVSRATFYLHYTDRDDLLVDVIDTIITTEVAAAARSGVIPPVMTEETPPPAYIVEFMRDIEANAPLFRQVLGAEGSARVAAHVRDQMHAALLELIRSAPAPMPRLVPDDVHAAWLSGALFGVIGHWLAADKRRPASKVANEIWRLAIQPNVRRHG